MTQEH